jgi:hypothetical protein
MLRSTKHANGGVRQDDLGWTYASIRCRPNKCEFQVLNFVQNLVYDVPGQDVAPRNTNFKFGDVAQILGYDGWRQDVAE